MAGNPIFDAIERDILGARHEISDWFHRDTHGTQAPAATPVTVITSPHEGETMQLADDLRNLATRLEPLGEEALGKLEAVAANPETAQVLGILHQLAGINLPAGVISEVATGLGTLLKIYAPQQAAA